MSSINTQSNLANALSVDIDTDGAAAFGSISTLGLTPKQLLRAVRGDTNKFSAAASAPNLPPPSAPRVQVTQRQITAYQSMAQDVNDAVAQVDHLTPPVQLNFNEQAIPPGTSPTEAAKIAVSPIESFLTAAVNGLSSADLITAFLTLRVTSQSDGLTTRQALSHLSSQMRQSELANEVKEDQEAAKKVQQALKKAETMGVLTKVFAAMTATLTAGMAVMTLGAGLGLAIVAAAMFIGAIAGGIADAKKNGKRFDMEGALNGASMGGDVAMAVLGLGAVLMALQEVAKAAFAQGAKAAVHETASKAAKTAAELVLQQAREIATEEVAQQGAKHAAQRTKQAAARQLLAQAEMLATEGLTNAAPEALNAAAKEVMKHAAQKTAADFRRALSWANHPYITQFRDAFMATFARLSTWDLSEVFPTNKATAFTGKGLKYALLASIGIQMTQQVSQSVIQYQANTFNLEAEQHQQLAAICERLANILQEEFDDLQNFMQRVAQSHSQAVNQAMGMLEQHFQTQMRAVQGMV